MKRVIQADAVANSNDLTNLHGLECDVQEGESYSLEMVWRVADSNAEGISIDFNGGSAEVDFFWASGFEGIAGSRHVSTKAEAFSYDAIGPGDGLIKVEGFLVANASGTFIPRFGQFIHSMGSITVKRGSWICLEEVVL